MVQSESKLLEQFGSLIRSRQPSTLKALLRPKYCAQTVDLFLANRSRRLSRVAMSRPGARRAWATSVKSSDSKLTIDNALMFAIEINHWEQTTLYVQLGSILPFRSIVTCLVANKQNNRIQSPNVAHRKAT
jgi:hypothetical protein